MSRISKILREEGILGLLAGIKRFLWWQCGGKYIDYYSHSIIDRPANRRIADMSVAFEVDSMSEFNRVKTFSGETDIIAWLLPRLNSEDVFWDVGANIGTYSLFVGQKVDSVVAFEPHPENVDRLYENEQINNLNIDIRSIALSNKNGTTSLLVNKEYAGAGGGELREDGQYEIEMRIGADIEPRPDVAKVDVEGHEIEVLEGMEKLLHDIRLIVVEVHDEENSEIIRDMLSDNGHSVELAWEIGTRRFLIGKSTS